MLICEADVASIISDFCPDVSHLQVWNRNQADTAVKEGLKPVWPGHDSINTSSFICPGTLSFHNLQICNDVKPLILCFWAGESKTEKRKKQEDSDESEVLG